MSKTKITEEKWFEAQTEEKKYHIHESLERSINFYKNLYGHYFSYLNINKNLEGKTILEIGPAKISALIFCENYNPSYIVEPIVFNDVSELYKNLPITFIRDMFEKCEPPIVDEIWLLNVMQHVLDPDTLIEKAKKHSKIIKFFEPINTGIYVHHPHSFTLDDYKSYFGNCVQYYGGHNSNFHTAECAYGIYQNI